MVDYYKTYLSDVRLPRSPQTPAMSIGSSFDAFVKAYLAKMFYGEVRPEFELQALFEQQVAKQHRDEAWKAGHYLFQQYKECGALADIMVELKHAIGEPKFEFEIRAKLPIEGCSDDGVPLLGKPDLSFLTKGNRIFVYDWKVNGWYSKSSSSPKKGYLKCRSVDGIKTHKDAIVITVDNISINAAHNLDSIDAEWAMQITTYAWILRSVYPEAIPDDFIAGIEQLLCTPSEFNRPKLFISSLRSRISKTFQDDLRQRYTDLWKRIRSGHIFTDMSREDSLAYQATFDKAIDDPDERLFREVMG